MKEKLKNKKVFYTIISIILVILVAIGITYAYWLVTRTQTKDNVISSACLDISLSNEANDISLTNQFPLSDEDGKELTPYTFTVTNNCNTSVDYQIALEAIGEESAAIASNAIKGALNNNMFILGSTQLIEPTIDDAYKAHKLTSGTLAPKDDEGSSVTYNLRLWIDKDANISEMNKTFKSKITVTVGQGIINPYKEGTLAYDILSNYNGQEFIVEYEEGLSETGLYKTIDDLGETYYFRGTPTNNYIILGEEAVSLEVDNIYWFYVLSGNYYYFYYDEATGEEFYGETFSSLEECEVDVQTKGLPTGICERSEEIQWYSDDYLTIEQCEAARAEKVEEFEGEDVVSCEERGNTSYTGNVPMVWQISRINGDGTIRLILAGHIVGSQIYEVSWQSKVGVYSETLYDYDYNDDTKILIGFSESHLYKSLDSWYKETLKNDYDAYVADGIFCQEKTDYKEYKYTVDTTEYVDKLYGENTPGFTCLSKNDRYTVNDTLNGNGLLSSPIGATTIDDVKYGGSYLSKSDFFTISFSRYEAKSESYYMYNTDGSEDTGCGNIRPIINLKADLKFTGKGTIDSPYEIVME